MDLGPTSENIESVETWPLDIVFKNLMSLVIDRRLNTERTPRRFASASALREWINLTRSLGDSLPFGGPSLRDHMRAVAERLERIQGWPSRFLKVPPRDKVGDEAFRQNAILWALEELRRTVNDSEQAVHGGAAPFQLRTSHFFEMLWRDLAPETQAKFEEDRVRKRLDEFRASLAPNIALELMFEVLHEALTHGPLRADGSRRPGLRFSPLDPPA
jgi:hypothetical protein